MEALRETETMQYEVPAIAKKRQDDEDLESLSEFERARRTSKTWEMGQD